MVLYHIFANIARILFILLLLVVYFSNEGEMPKYYTLKEHFQKAVKSGKKDFHHEGKSYKTEDMSKKNPSWRVDALSNNSPVIDRLLEQARKDLKLDFRVSGGDRLDKSKNKKTGGRSKSQHLIKGSARDISLHTPTLTKDGQKKLKKYMLERGFSSIDESDATHGTGNHLHFDSRKNQVARKMVKPWLQSVRQENDPYADEVIREIKKKGKERAKSNLPATIRMMDEKRDKQTKKEIKEARTIKDPYQSYPYVGDTPTVEKLTKKDKKDIKKIEKLSKAITKAEKDDDKNSKKIANLREHVAKINEPKETFAEAFKREYQDKGAGETFMWKGKPILLEKEDKESNDFRKMAMTMAAQRPSQVVTDPSPPMAPMPPAPLPTPSEPMEPIQRMPERAPDIDMPEMDGGMLDTTTGREYLRGQNPVDMEPKFADGGTAYSKIYELLKAKDFNR